MLARRSDLLFLFCTGALVAAQPVAAQVVATETVMSSGQARLTVEAVDQPRLEISFSNGDITIDGNRVGDYEDGGALDRSWRSLLRRVANQDGNRVSGLIRNWSPPAGLEGDRSELAARLDQALERIAAGDAQVSVAPAVAGTVQEPGAVPMMDRARLERLLESLIGGAGFEEAARAVERARDGELDLRVGDDVHVHEGETITGTLVVVGADIDVEGEINGDVIVSDGTLTLQESGRIRGDVHLLDARLDREGGRISGTVVRPDRAVPETRVREQIRNEIRREIRDEYRHENRRSRSFIRNMGHGISGILQTAVQLAIMVALGMVLLHFAPDNMTRVAQVARDYPARSAAVGMAGFFLLVPVWLVGMVALAISIIGIPLLIAWVPLVPVAAGIATLTGCLAVALNLGRWLQRHDFERLRWAHDSNHLNHLILGVGLLSAAFLASHVVSAFGPWFGFFEGLLTTIGCLGMIATAVVGFGAVLLTRGGRQDLYENGGFEFEWRPRWERTAAGASAVAEDVMDVAADVVDDLADAAGAAAHDLKKAAGGAADAASDRVDDAGEAIEDVADDIADAQENGIDDDIAEDEGIDDESKPDGNHG